MDKFQQAKQIAAGTTNYLRLQLNIADKDVENVQRKRNSVCIHCPYRDPDLNVCTACGCLLAIKTRSMEASCIKGFWGAVK